MVKSFDGLKGDALIIKNEIEQDKNSATRIGTMFSDVVDKMEDESETQELNLQQAIEAEAQARQTADKNLQDAITNLDGRLKQESNVRNNAVKAVQENLDAEIAMREVAYLGDLGDFAGVEAVGFVDSLVASIGKLGKGMGRYSFNIGGGGAGSKQFVTLAKVGSLTKLTIEGCLKAEVLNGDGAIDSVTSTVSTVVECDVTKKVWSYVNTVVDDTYYPEMLDEATVDEEAVQRSNKVMSKEQTLGVIGEVNRNVGIDEYPLFSDQDRYVEGDVVAYKGCTYRFITTHAGGAWNDSEVAKWNEKESLSKLFPFLLEQGTIYNMDLSLKRSVNRVRTKFAYDSNTIKSIKCFDDIYMYTYVFEKNGKYRGIIGWTQSIAPSNDFCYMTVFGKGEDRTQPISPADVYEKCLFSPPSASEELYIQKEEELNKFFIPGFHGNANAAFGFKLAYYQTNPDYSCLSLKVKKGDKFVINNLKAGLNLAKPFAVYDNTGHLLYNYSDSNIVPAGYEVNIQEDGFILFNSLVNSPISITGSSVFLSSDFLPAYLWSLFNKQDKSPGALQVKELDITQLFYVDGFLSITNKKYNPDNIRLYKGLRCISVKVKAGDYFDINNLKGGGNEARAYGLFNTEGELLYSSDANYTINERINITENGFAVFNAENDDFRIVGSFNFFEDWNWHYIAPLIENVNNLRANVKSINDDINRLYLDTSLQENAFYDLEAKASSFNSVRIVYNTEHEWKNGDKLEKVVLSTKLSLNENQKETILRIYDKNKILKDSFSLGVVGDGDVEIDVSDKGIVLRDGDIVALSNIYYRSYNGNTHFYDLATDTVIENYAYCFGFRFTREKSLKEDFESIKNDGIPKTLKVLCFGNSFTQDSMSYVPTIIRNIDKSVKLKLGIGFIGGCPLVQHLANLSGVTQSLETVEYSPMNYTFYLNNGDKWYNLGAKSAKELLSYDTWDIITFQQNGGTAYKEWDKYFAPFIYKIHRHVFDKLKNPVQLGWLLTQGAYGGYDEDFKRRWEGTADNAKKIMTLTGTSVLFPFGTAVQNLRTTSLNSLGDGGLGNLVADSGHLQEGIGCLTAAYANALVLLKFVGINKGVIGDSLRPDENFITEITVPGPNMGETGVIGITEKNCFLAQVAAVKAVMNPYELTDLTNVEND